MSEKRQQAMTEITDQITLAASPSEQFGNNDPFQEQTQPQEVEIIPASGIPGVIQDQYNNLQFRFNTGRDKVQQFGNNLAFRIESIPIPGGIRTPLIVLLVFYLILIPTNGHTRLVWLWNTIIGNAHIKYNESLHIYKEPDTSTSTNTNITPITNVSLPTTPKPPSDITLPIPTSPIIPLFDYSAILSRGSYE